MITKFQKKEKKENWMITFFKFSVFILILLAIGFLVFWNIKIKKIKDSLNAQLASIEKEIENLQEKNEALKEGIAHVGDEDYVEKVAREELNLQREGEKVVSFILPESKEEKGSGKHLWQPSYWKEWFSEKWQWIKGLF